MSEIINTKFYRTGKESETPLFAHRVVYRAEPKYRDRIRAVSVMDRPVADLIKMFKGEYHDIHQVCGTTVCVNSIPRNKNKVSATITGLPTDIERAKSFLEELTELQLIEVNILGVKE